MKELTRIEFENEEQKVKLEKLYHQLQEVKRTAYIPVTEEKTSEFDASSKMGGYPYLRSEEDWPKCPGCKKHLHLFVQLNERDLPERNEKGIIQLFYCVSEDMECENMFDSWEPFSKGTIVRRIEADKPSVKVSTEEIKTFPEKKIVGWKVEDDYPDPQEYDDWGIEAEDEILEFLYDEDILLPLSGDKLLGWPHWIQSPEIPFDEENGVDMEYLFQIDSEINIPFMFGDSGAGHITQSPKNKELLTFGWACC